MREVSGAGGENSSAGSETEVAKADEPGRVRVHCVLPAERVLRAVLEEIAVGTINK